MRRPGGSEPDADFALRLPAPVRITAAERAFAMLIDERSLRAPIDVRDLHARGRYAAVRDPQRVQRFEPLGEPDDPAHRVELVDRSIPGDAIREGLHENAEETSLARKKMGGPAAR